MRLKRNKQKGFTLVELLVTLAITSILSTVILANFRGTANQRAVNNAANKVVSDLAKAQSSSLSSRNATSTPASAHGINFDTSVANRFSYRIVVDDNAATPNRTTIATIPLSDGVYVGSITVVNPTLGTSTPSSNTIIFKVPYGRILNTYSTVTNEKDDVVTIRLYSSNPSVYKDIVVNGVAGTIYKQ